MHFFFYRYFCKVIFIESYQVDNITLTVIDIKTNLGKCPCNNKYFSVTRINISIQRSTYF